MFNTLAPVGLALSPYIANVMPKNLPWWIPSTPSRLFFLPQMLHARRGNMNRQATNFCAPLGRQTSCISSRQLASFLNVKVSLAAAWRARRQQRSKFLSLLKWLICFNETNYHFNHCRPSLSSARCSRVFRPGGEMRPNPDDIYRFWFMPPRWEHTLLAREDKNF